MRNMKLCEVNIQVAEDATGRYSLGILRIVKEEKGLGQNSEEHLHVR